MDEMTKIGPELLVNVRSRSASSFVIRASSYNFRVKVAPIGYPLNIPRKKARLHTPGTLNKGRIIFSKEDPIIKDTFVFFNISHITKKGKRDGKIKFPHKYAPNLQAMIASFEYIISNVMNKAQKELVIISEKIFVLCNLKYRKSKIIISINRNLLCLFSNISYA